MMFRDRAAAGRFLGRRLAHLRGAGAVALGLPRGGVPVAFEVARALGLPLDVIVVRKVGVPGDPELAMGAVGEDGVTIVNAGVVAASRVSPAELAAAQDRARAELERCVTLLRGGRPRISLAGRTAVIVDKGMATGATARAACQVARGLGAARVVVAVPVAAGAAAEAVAEMADEMVCLVRPASFAAVGRYYADVTPTTDVEVAALLACSRREATSPSSARAPGVEGEGEVVMKGWTVDDVMTQVVVSVEESAGYRTVVDLLIGRRISAVPVVDAFERVVGVVSEADLLRKIEYAGDEAPRLFEGRRRRGERGKALGASASELMSAPAVTVLAGASIADAARLMDGEDVKRLPVVDDLGRLVGIVTRGDLLKVYLRPDDDLRDEVEAVVRDEEVTPGVSDGVVTLEGRVAQASTAEELIRLTRQVPGVVMVVDRIRYANDDRPVLATDLAYDAD